MNEEKNLTIHVRNLGPIVSGMVELKPLTLFIGPNNSGKSYMALLAYALTRAVNGRPLDRSADRYGPAYRFGEYEAFDKYKKDFQEFLETLLRKRKDPLLSTAPSRIQQAFQEQFAAHLDVVREQCAQSVRNYFSVDHLVDLLHSSRSGEEVCIQLSAGRDESPFLTMRQSARNASEVIEIDAPKVGEFHIPLKRIRASGAGAYAWRFLADSISGDIFRRWMQDHAVPETYVFYLPAARSGVLQGWQMLASMALETVGRFAGRRQITVPTISGVARDFIQILLELNLPRARRPNEAMKHVISALEEGMFHGNVSMVTSRTAGAQLVYKSGEIDIPVERASSMVAELAPLALWLKYVVKPGDILIIDEPEAHLHPENQRRIARVLVRLVRAGVKVICPTHSSLIVHQLSNYLLASQLSAEQRNDLGYMDCDELSKEELGVYLFDSQESETRIREVPIDEEFGISEEDFISVLESIGDETYRVTAVRDIDPEQDGI